MADERKLTDEQKRYSGNVAETEEFRTTAEKVEPHQGQNKVTTSTEGKVETTTKEK